MEQILIQKEEGLPPRLLALLPAALSRELAEVGNIDELHLRAGRRAVVSVGAENRCLETLVSAEALEEIARLLQGGSHYAYRERLCEGFLPFDGIRVGVSGQVACENGRIAGVQAITSLNFRIPHRISAEVDFVRPLLASFPSPKGILVYAPPGGGKTTFLRECARALASGKDSLRVAVVDSRGELGYSLGAPSLNLDLLTGYPKARGIEIAFRTLGAQVIVCDELGDGEEIQAILSLPSGGVPLIASAHGAALSALLARPPMAALHRAGVFGAYIRVDRWQKPVVTPAEDARC